MGRERKTSAMVHPALRMDYGVLRTVTSSGATSTKSKFPFVLQEWIVM
jgi:hypothetical protein